jgi:hypothetical protein
MGGCASAPALPQLQSLPDGSARVPVNAPATQEQLALRGQMHALQRELAALKSELTAARTSTPRRSTALEEGTATAMAPVAAVRSWSDTHVDPRGLRPQLVANAAPRVSAEASITDVIPAAPRPAELKAFEIASEDKVLANCLQRWGRAAGYEVLWESSIEAPLDARAAGRRVMARDFKAALAKTIEALQQLGYPIKALVYSDQVVRIVSKEQPV